MNLGQAQSNPSFYVEVPNSNFIPIVTHDIKTNTRIAYMSSGNRSLDALINSYKIYKSQHVFTNSQHPMLQNIYLIECDDITLMTDLSNSYLNLYPRTEDAFRESLALPNDFGTTGGYTGDDQEELNFIRAQEAWDITTGSNNIYIGIADTNYQTQNRDLIGTLDVVYGNNNPNAPSQNQHGTKVACIAACNTNNNFGMSSIGYNSYIKATTGFTSGLNYMYNLPGIKVMNASWGGASSNPPSITPYLYELINDNDIVMIAAAGNGRAFGQWNSTAYYSPASYKHVISVSGIGHSNETYITGFGLHETFPDHHEYTIDGVPRSYQHNDSIDIVAPSYGISLPVYIPNQEPVNYMAGQGTSYAAPMVAGTVALMFDVNYCLKPNEVETILKLTAVKIDNLPQNIQYYGKLGAGKLDAYEAVKMAKDMADPFGTVEVKDRILYRPWFYKLETAPYEIKMTNNSITQGSKLKFRARNNIEILSGKYSPGTGGYVDLQIDENLSLNNCSPPPSGSRMSNIENLSQSKKIEVSISPTLIFDKTKIFDQRENKGILSVKVYDIFGY